MCDKTDYDGKRDGLESTFHKNGQLGLRGHWKDGEREGLWIWFDENGNPIWTETYDKSWNLNLLSFEESVSREINQSSSHCVTKQTTNCYTK
jgi:hypothetical protein